MNTNPLFKEAWHINEGWGCIFGRMMACINVLLDSTYTVERTYESRLKTFYDLAKRTRTKVLDWLEILPPEVFTLEHEPFAFGSLRNIYVHVADCYLGWGGEVGLKHKPVEIKVNNVNDLRSTFDEVDATVAKALETFVDPDKPFTSPSEQTLTPRWLILHTITHEFHHKGQALALARVLGHPHPGNPDTDLVVP
jgi:uncharacterized damage-inducible protein DinB